MYVPVPPHGGLTEPVSRTVPAEEINDFLAHAATLTKMPVSDADLFDRLSPGRRRAQPLDRADGLGHL